MTINGLVVMTPSSIAYSGTSASINADGSVDFSAVTSLSLNGVFTGDYDNYMVNIRCSITGTNRTVKFRLRASGIDESSASNYYTFQDIVARNTTVFGARTTTNEGRFFLAGYGDGSEKSGGSCYLFGPYLAQPTASRAVAVSNHNVSPSASIHDYATTHSLSNSYDGFTVYPSGDLMTGLLTVFGFNQ